MYIRQKYIVVVVIVLCYFQINAQSKSNDCLEYLRNYNALLSNIQNIDENKSLHLSYSITNNLSDYSIPTTDDISMIISEDMLQYNSKYIDMYHDKYDSYVVLKSTKKILVNNSTLKEGKYRDLSYLSMFRDSILDRCIIEACNDTINSVETGQRFIQIAFDKELRKELNIIRQKLYFNLESGLLEKLITYYTPGFEYKTTSIVVNRIETQHNKSSLVSARDMIYTKKGKLKSKYPGYSFIDNRD